MQQHQLNKEYEFEGILRELLSDYVVEKRALGNIFNTQAKKLREFSRMSANLEIPKNTLPEEVVKAWIARRPNDADKTVYQRYEIIRGFAEYMRRIECTAYCPVLGDIPKTHWHTYIPYIFTHDEILRFFDALDAIQKSRYSNSRRRHTVMPVLFRLLYCCGLRVSEATRLTVYDVDADNGILTIRDSKFEKSRYIPMSPEMAETIRKYMDCNIHEPHLFPSRDGGMYSNNSIYEMFRQTLFAAEIPHQGRGKGPRVHDFRHTFAVHCLQKWIQAGVPMTSSLPRLSTYLGHNDLVATEKYLRMTAEVHPEISEMLSRAYGSLIPKGGDVS